MGQASTSTHIQASRTNNIIYNPYFNRLTVKPIPSRARLVAAEKFFSLRFLFNDPAKKVVLGHFLWGLRLRSIDPANHHAVAGLDVESEFNLPIGRRLSWWSLRERVYCSENWQRWVRCHAERR